MFRVIVPAVLLIGSSAALSADRSGYEQRQAEKERVELEKQLAGLVPGKPEQCLNQRFYTDTTRVGDTILYKSGRNDVYRTDTTGGCFGLRRGDAIITKSFTGELCQGDIVRTVDLVSHVPSGSCTFGPFVHYTKP